MTLAEELEKTRDLLALVQNFRQTVAAGTEGAAKPDLLAQADVSIAKLEAHLRNLEAVAAGSRGTLQ